MSDRSELILYDILKIGIAAGKVVIDARRVGNYAGRVGNSVRMALIFALRASCIWVSDWWLGGCEKEACSKDGFFYPSSMSHDIVTDSLVSQGGFGVCCEAWVAFERVWLAELHAFEGRGVCLAARLMNLKLGVNTVKLD